MRYFVSLILYSFLFASCCGPKCTKPENKSKTNSVTAVGADKDLHGCKASAGYQWSELKMDCIRSFELPLQIDNSDKTSRTGVLFSEDSSKAEIFSNQGHFLLERSSSGHYMKTTKRQSAHLDRNEKGEWLCVFEN